MLITRDYGGEVLVDQPADGLTESSSALRVLDDSVNLETRYGGGFAQSINGLSGGTDGGRRSDWFYSVNGIVAERGAADYPVTDGDRVWWDYRDWTDAMEIGAVVGAFPAPMVGGYDGQEWPVRVDCPGGGHVCDRVRTKLKEAGAELVPSLAADPEAGTEDGKGAETDREVLRVLVGPWDEVGRTFEGQRLNRGPSRSGVFARFELSIPPRPVGGDGRGAAATGSGAVARSGADAHLIGLDRRAEPARDFGPGAGLVAAMRQGDSPPVWLVTGGSGAGVGRAAALLDQTSLQGRYAAAVADGETLSLPLPDRLSQ
ncbi:MAG: DUF4430 domain-containing protein [Thermoleophilia bacterium]|nr:DUF4430 domain-containing protein [Thermoleophilia bacterium]